MGRLAQTLGLTFSTPCPVIVREYKKRKCVTLARLQTAKKAALVKRHKSLSRSPNMEPSAFFQSLRLYLDAFAEHDSARRFHLLEQSLISNAEVWGPTSIFTGYAEISEKIEVFHKNWPNCRLVLASGIICFNNAGHFAQTIVGSDGSVLTGGHSVLELAQDGRISRVLAFWGPQPPLPESWPAHHLAQALRGGSSAA